MKSIDECKLEISTIKYLEGYLVIEGSVKKQVIEYQKIIYFIFKEVLYRCYIDTEEDERERRKFIVTIPVDNTEYEFICGVVKKGKKEESILIEYENTEYKNTYYCFGGESGYIVTFNDGRILIEKKDDKKNLEKEKLLKAEIREKTDNIFQYIKRAKQIKKIYKQRKNENIELKEIFESRNPMDIKARSYRHALECSVLPSFIERGVAKKSRNITDRFFDESIDNKTIVVLGLGHHVKGNLHYILEELNKNEVFKGYRIYVRTNEKTELSVSEYIAEKNWKRTKTVCVSREYSRIMETAKYLLTEVYFPEGWIKKPGQVVINIWHGTPLKKLGLDQNLRVLHHEGNTQKNFINSDYLLYPNNYTKENMLDSFRIKGLLSAKILMLGYPRTGGLLRETKNQEIIKNKLAPNGEKIYVYMPTWKDYMESEQVVQQSWEFLSFMESSLLENEIMYVKLHHRVEDSIDYTRLKKIRPFPDNMDSYEILAASEVLITDYSSVFFDYLATRKHIILYCPDYQEYKEKRGVYEELYSFPFDKAKNKEAVLEKMRIEKQYDDSKMYNKFCQYDTENNAKKLCRLFADDTKNLCLEAISGKQKSQVLIYMEKWESQDKVEKIHKVIKAVNKNRTDVYLGCENDEVDKNLDIAYPVLFEANCFGTETNRHMSALAKGAFALYSQGEMTFDEYMKYAEYDYRLDNKRMFGNAEFDIIIIYNVSDSEKYIALSLLSGKKCLYINTEDITEIEQGDQYKRDAIIFAAARADVIYVQNERDCEYMRDKLKIHNKTEIYREDQQLLNNINNRYSNN